MCVSSCSGIVSLYGQDALNEIARQRPKDLFKPLRVHFIGEDGIDAGGVKKEFFQLLVTELLSPDYGMLVFQPVRTPTMNHATTSMESLLSYQLVIPHLLPNLL